MGILQHLHWRFMNFCHRYQQQVQTTSRALFISTLNKTRYCSNISFIKTCLQHSVTPNGFVLKHHHGVSILDSTQQRITSSLNRCTRRIMRTNLFEYNYQVRELTKQRTAFKTQLQENVTPDIYRHIFHLFH